MLPALWRCCVYGVASASWGLWGYKGGMFTISQRWILVGASVGWLLINSSELTLFMLMFENLTVFTYPGIEARYRGSPPIWGIFFVKIQLRKIWCKGPKKSVSLFTFITRFINCCHYFYHHKTSVRHTLYFRPIEGFLHLLQLSNLSYARPHAACPFSVYFQIPRGNK